MLIVRIQTGQSIAVGDRRITALSVPRPGLLETAIEGESLPVTLACDRKLELFPDVFVTLMRGSGCYSKWIRVGFFAPPHIRIRELAYERGS